MIRVQNHGKNRPWLACSAGLVLLCASASAWAADAASGTWIAEPTLDLSATATVFRQGAKIASFSAATATAAVRLSSEARACDLGGFASYQAADHADFDGVGRYGVFLDCDRRRWSATGWLMAFASDGEGVRYLFGTELKYDLGTKLNLGIQLLVPLADTELTTLSAGASWSFTDKLSLGVMASAGADGDPSYQARLEFGWDIL